MLDINPHHQQQHSPASCEYHLGIHHHYPADLQNSLSKGWAVASSLKSHPRQILTMPASSCLLMKVRPSSKGAAQKNTSERKFSQFNGLLLKKQTV